MNERQPIPLYEWKNSLSPSDVDLMVIAERELGAFMRAVTELFGPEQARLAAGLGRRAGVNGCFAWTDQARLGIGHHRRLGPACKTAESQLGPCNATRCVD